MNLERKVFKTYKKVEKTIGAHNMIASGDAVLVALSGGADSVMLLDFLVKYRDKKPINIFASHINHNLRGEESNRDQIFVQHLCENVGIDLFVKSVDIKKIAKEQAISTEEAGRNVRYNFFKENVTDIEKRTSAQVKIATAHHRNDNVETILMRLLRGTAILGLCGIAYTRSNIIRPLLDISRSEIEQYVNDLGLPFVSDSTNAQDIYTRNNIRLNLIPYLEENYNSNIVNTIAENVHLFSMDSDCLEIEALAAFERFKVIQDDSISLKLSDLKTIHSALCYRVIKAAVKSLTDSITGIETLKIKTIMELINAKNSENISYKVSLDNLGANIMVFIEKGYLTIKFKI